MPNSSIETTLQRMVTRGGLASRKMTIERAFTLGLPKAAERSVKLPLNPSGIEMLTARADTAIDHLPAGGLVGYLGSRDGAIGVVALDSQTLAALIEIQTTGAVRSGNANPREATRTDAYMCDHFIDSIFAEIESLLSDSGSNPWSRGYRFERRVDDRRKLPMRLEASEYLVCEAALDLGDGQKQGSATFIVSADETAAEGSEDAEDAKMDWGDALTPVVSQSVADLEAILLKVQYKISQLAEFKPGDLIRFPPSKLGKVQIVGSNGISVAQATLGQMQGMRAIKIQGTERNLASVQMFDPADGTRSDHELLAVEGEREVMPMDPTVQMPEPHDVTAELPEPPDLPELPMPENPEI